ncbi:hypothetical protein KGF57_001448 [Candida theae]|uniref:Uncharacterized protein n=1 Tax=Candida theae TaxID=1198502 RepID=A0AAD5BGY3_9ASCO|nr:uncharacterized protein KGF57_001448 [Candida theae]KAI5962714.1 hypothetical protein KGF57_001448 [Candida theae]
MTSLSPIGATGVKSRFYSYQKYSTPQSDNIKDAFAEDLQESLQHTVEINHNLNMSKCKDKHLTKVEATNSLHNKPSSFHPLQNSTETKSTDLVVASKISRFSRFINKFHLRIAKTTCQSKKFNTVTGADMTPHITEKHPTSTWRRRFSKHHTSMFYPSDNGSLPLRLASENVTNTKLCGIFSPPVPEPMKTIDSLKDDLIKRSAESPPVQNLFDFDSFYNDKFFTTGVRRPITYDNSQITDETIVA